MIYVPKITRLSAVDLPDPASWRPTSSKDIYLAIELTIFIDVQPLGDFQLVVASEAGIRDWRDRYGESAPVFPPQYTMAVEGFDWSDICARISKRASDCAAPSVEEATQKLRRAFFWEYEGFKWVDDA